MILAIILASWLAKKIAAPLTDLEAATQKIAQGDFSTRILLKENTETKKLVDGFNYMSEQLQQLVQQLKDQKQEVDIIIESIQEGLLVIDSFGITNLANNSLKKLFNVNQPEKKYYWEYLREPSLSEVIKKTMETGENNYTELTIQDKNYLVSTARLAGKNGLALFFRDITEFRQLEKMKKDFITNASHELRTPLTAIKGFVETLDDEIKDLQQKHYLQIIKNHTERLINIVQDIMTLSELEERSNSLKLEKINLRQLITEIYSIFDQKIKEKKLFFKIEGDAEVNVDAFKLQQVFINLLDNALKYTEKGGITVILEQQKENILIKIKDTGCGIPKEDLPRVFERFYVVDKSRARKLGGTGLGLAIVKHIISLHKGTITVKSEINQGSEFIISLSLI